MRIILLLSGLFAALTASAQADYTFSDGGRKATYQLSATEVFSKSAGDLPSADSSKEWGGGKVLTLRSGTAMRKLRNSRSATLAPVFYDMRDLPSAERLAVLPENERVQRMASARRVMTAKLHIRMDDSRWSALAATKPLSYEKSLLAGWMLITYSDAFAALDAADFLTKQGTWEFTPVFTRMMAKRQALVREVNDPLYPKQWHLASTGMNLNMKNSWDQVTGKGINMTIVDDGLEIRHEDRLGTVYVISCGNGRDENGLDCPRPYCVGRRQDR